MPRSSGISYDVNYLIQKIAPVLGVPADEIRRSEKFEQSVYNMAKERDETLPAQDFSGSAKCVITSGNDKQLRIEITYDKNANTEALANFYHKFFPKTRPIYTYGMEQSISFLMKPFIEMVLPAMKLSLKRPSNLQLDSIQYVDSDNMLISTSKDPGLDKAVFISGADPLLGQWETAFRLTYNTTKHVWEYPLPSALKENEFKFLIGAFDQGLTTKTNQLTWDEGENKVFVVHEHIEEVHSQQPYPIGIGVRC